MNFLDLFKDPLFVAIPATGGALTHSKNIDRILALNNDTNKCGAYFTVNGFKNFKEGEFHGRTKANVSSFNGNFLDIDLTPDTKRMQAELIYKDLCDKKLQPTAVILTGKGLHVYWLYKEPMEFGLNRLKEYEALQLAIIDHFKSQGADPQARDAARVLRIPNARYYNKKGEYECEVELLYLNPESRYTPLEIAEFFKNTIRIDTEEGKNLVKTDVEDFDLQKILHVKVGTRHHAAYSAAMSIIQSSKSLAHARRFFEAVLKTWESPVNDPMDWFDMWNQFEEAKRFLEKDRPQLFVGDKDGVNIVIQSFEDIKGKKVDWLWEGFIARGKTHMLTGDPGLGKSQITLDIASRLSNGTPFPSYTLGVKSAREPIGVIILSSEDDASDTIKPRLIAAGADMKYIIHMASTIVEKGKDGKAMMRSIALRDDAEQILKAISTVSFKVGLIIIDPISAFLSGKQDSNSNSDARGTLAQLQSVVMDKGIALLMINHNNKNTSAKSAHMRSMGSVGWNAAARATFYVFKDKEDENRRIFSIGKMNLVKDSGKGFFFKVANKTVNLDGEEVDAPYIEWDDKNFPVKTADDYSVELNKRKETKADECMDFLEMYMVDKMEGIDAVEGLKYMQEQGFTRSEVYRCAREMGLTGTRGIWKK